MTRKKKYNRNRNKTVFNNKEIFVWAQISEENGVLALNSVTLELLCKARKLGEDISKKIQVSAVLCLKEPLNELQNGINDIKRALYEGGADKIYLIKSEKIKSSIGAAKAAAELCRAKEPQIFLIGATVEGRTVAPLIATELETGLTADCTKLEITTFKDEKKLASTRPTFGGQLMATILCKNLPQMATVRPGVLTKIEEPYKECGENFEGFEYEEFIPALEGFNDPITILGVETNKQRLSSELENAKIVVAGGKGLKNEDNFEKLKKFARLAGGAVAASRGAVDAGLIDKKFQVGQTGKTIAPDVYIAFGISGAIHHMSGVENAKKIIAVNTDENAPIFENADVAITEDAAVVLDELIKELETNPEDPPLA